MIHLLSLLISMTMSPASISAQPIDTPGLRQQIIAEFEKQPTGTFAVAFKDLSTNQEFFINAHDLFHAASTMKTAVLIETYRQAGEHKFNLNDSVTVHTNFISIYDGSAYTIDSSTDSEKDLYFKVGSKVLLSDLLFRMITKSSNLSTNIIIQMVGAKNVMNTIAKMGAHEMQVLRGVEDTKAFEHDMNNKVTANDLMILFDHLAHGTAVSKKASDDMIDILTHQHFRDVIPAKLPEGIRVANKSGSITGICHDSGIVFLPDGRKYIVVLLSRGVQDQNASTETLSTVSKIIYDHMQQH